MNRAARSLMVWGTSSGAGKSWLTTALCRVARRRGIAVAPFKAQNMSNNARVVPGGQGEPGEIGSAQYFQALAAGVLPEVDMNPVLLKPERDTASQVVLQGRVDAALSRMPWRERSDRLAAAARESFHRLASRHELVVIEGAGSPAEINLAEHDYVNLATARWARDLGGLQCVLVSDIDRGGAFAHLYGTWALLPQDLRHSLSGFVLNKFRGDAGLLAPGPQQLQELSGVPVIGTLPMRRDHGLPEEDGVFDDGASGSGAVKLRVAVIATPHISNLDEFQPLKRVPGLWLVWARTPAALEGADWIVLPGSKQVSGDLAWLRAQGLDQAIRAHAAAGRPVLGICGGLQMLGEHLSDPAGFDGEPHAQLAGLGLLPLGTRYEACKKLVRTRATFTRTQGAWSALSGVAADGYEIRHGSTQALSSCGAVLQDAQGEPIGWQHGPVLGVYAHGLFESPAVLRALFGAEVPLLDDAFDTLADMVEEHIDARALDRLLGKDWT
ncbi:cobyric acid synthase [Piscinibacter terrae]|uniref:Cobyric acid synthase n=1 Tax=Piscinibacter terrae TaxID=2496871 RepID=A0A3N7HZI3_9BURK|nr:cobyric acid synthase [Albitalea terrae]RQP26531.1 cobyric acid synthase [Albitalea terrae]